MMSRTEEKERMRRAAEIGPACETCALRKGCADAQEGRFCPRWRGREIPEERTRDGGPAEAWARGEEAAL